MVINQNLRVKLGLSNIAHLHKLLQSPFDKFPIIHVAGTNGKGSVCLKIAKCIESCGKRVGLFTSPHVSTFRERIQVNGRMIEQERVVQLVDLICATSDKNGIPATFFELTTAMAACYFKEENVDYIVLETGLGGRLDATNIVNPLATVITSVSIEHAHILGNTIEEIAKEKAGIVKPGVPS